MNSSSFVRCLDVFGCWDYSGAYAEETWNHGTCKSCRVQELVMALTSNYRHGATSATTGFTTKSTVRANEIVRVKSRHSWTSYTCHCATTNPHSDSISIQLHFFKSCHTLGQNCLPTSEKKLFAWESAPRANLSSSIKYVPIIRSIHSRGRDCHTHLWTILNMMLTNWNGQALEWPGWSWWGWILDPSRDSKLKKGHPWCSKAGLSNGPEIEGHVSQMTFGWKVMWSTWTCLNWW